MTKLVERAFSDHVISSVIVLGLLGGWFNRQNEGNGRVHHGERVKLTGLEEDEVDPNFIVVLPCKRRDDRCLIVRQSMTGQGPRVCKYGIRWGVEYGTTVG